MAREYGKVMMSAWVDSDFTKLTRRAQGTYFFLVSQPDLNRAGVVTMALNRWSSRCSDGSRALLLEDLTELALGGFIVVDESNEELLVRTLVRNDEGWKSPNVMIAIAAAARQVSSPTLRSVLGEEFQRIDTSGLSTKVNEKTGRSTREFIESIVATATEQLGECVKDPAVMAWGTLPERVPASLREIRANQDPVEPFQEPFDEPFLEGSPTETETEPKTETEPERETEPSLIAQPSPEPPGFEAFMAAYPSSRDKGHARTAWVKAVRKADGPTIIAGAERFRDDPNREQKFTPYPAKWLNGEQWGDEPLPARSSTTGPVDRQGDLLKAEMERINAKTTQPPSMFQIGDGS